MTDGLRLWSGWREAKTGTRAVPNDRQGQVVPIASNSLGELKVLYAYCRCCRHDRQLDARAPLRRHGGLHLYRLRARLRCTACGAHEAEINRATTLPKPQR